MGPYEKQEDDVLRALIAGETKVADHFFTVSAFEGTTVFHGGLGSTVRASSAGRSSKG